MNSAEYVDQQIQTVMLVTADGHVLDTKSMGGFAEPNA